MAEREGLSKGDFVCYHRDQLREDVCRPGFARWWPPRRCGTKRKSDLFSAALVSTPAVWGLTRGIGSSAGLRRRPRRVCGVMSVTAGQAELTKPPGPG